MRGVWCTCSDQERVSGDAQWALIWADSPSVSRRDRAVTELKTSDVLDRLVLT